MREVWPELKKPVYRDKQAQTGATWWPEERAVVTERTVMSQHKDGQRRSMLTSVFCPIAPPLHAFLLAEHNRDLEGGAAQVRQFLRAGLPRPRAKQSRAENGCGNRANGEGLAHPE